MGFRFVQKSMTLNDLDRPKRNAITGNQKSISLGAQRSANISFTKLLVQCHDM